jgi:hypothetical protein
LENRVNFNEKNCFTSLSAGFMDSGDRENYLLSIGIQAVKIRNRIAFKIGCFNGDEKVTFYNNSVALIRSLFVSDSLTKTDNTTKQCKGLTAALGNL